MKLTMRQWWKSGDPWIWLNAAAVSASLIIVFGLLMLIAVRGLSHFWPSDIAAVDYKDAQGPQQFLGEMVNEEWIDAVRYEEAGLGDAPEGQELVERVQMKVGNRDITEKDFLWIDRHNIQGILYPEQAIRFERVEWGNLYGYLRELQQAGVVQTYADDQALYQDLEARVKRVEEIRGEIRSIERGEIGEINYALEKLRLERRKLELQDKETPAALAKIAEQELAQNQQYLVLREQLNLLNADIRRDQVVVEVSGGKRVQFSLDKLVSIEQPNLMSVFDKMLHYLHNLWNFMAEDPREANTEGGIFPAIFGTVMMVLLMSVLVTPMGVIAAVYLREYARQGIFVRVVSIAVNNLAGVPSIVYGVFGLGFFVYFLGGSIDQLFFPERLPAPTFGTPGLLWASLTLALLTVPVVIVSTEEGLSRIPRNLREGSLALGATKAETIWKVVLPMASPSIMTGLILAVARAAGEVAPLMLVGVVKLAPELALDGNSPFLHLDRKFMHLGFHIYDVGFQSPNVEAARPLVFATALLLVTIIMALNLTAIMLRNHLRNKYRSLDS